ATMACCPGTVECHVKWLDCVREAIYCLSRIAGIRAFARAHIESVPHWLDHAYDVVRLVGCHSKLRRREQEIPVRLTLPSVDAFKTRPGRLPGSPKGPILPQNGKRRAP